MKWYSWLFPHFKNLITGYKTGRGHHALLIQALPGIGDAEFVYAITSFLMCHSPKGYKVCGECHGCWLMKSNTHPDYYTLNLERGKVSLGIDVIREVIEKLHRHAWLGSNKVVWITDAHLLTEEAANALLKTLEEPPEKTWFFLSCREPLRLLATLRSRCRLYCLAVPQESWALMWLQRRVVTSKEQALSALRLCSGAPVSALELLKPMIRERREHLCSLLRDVIKNQDWLSLLTVLDNDYVLESLHWLISLFLDALKIQYDATLITNVDNKILVDILAHFFSKTLLWTILKGICKCRTQLIRVAGVNRELILINQLLYIEYYIKSDIKFPISYL